VIISCLIFSIRLFVGSTMLLLFRQNMILMAKAMSYEAQHPVRSGSEPYAFLF